VIATGILSRYFARRFVTTVVAVLFAVFVLVVLVDYVESMRRASGVANVSTWTVVRISLYRVPQVTEKILPFCVLVAAMTCYLGLSRRLELVVARAAGMSAWQFVAPAVLAAFFMGVIATAAYNPVAASLKERSKRLESEMSGERPTGLLESGGGYWLRQRSPDGQSIINATTSREQGASLDGLTIFTFDTSGKFRERIAAKSARLEPGHWRLTSARVYENGVLPRDYSSYLLNTNLTIQQVSESFSTPETVAFWQLPMYIDMAEQVGRSAAGYKVQYQMLLAQPFLLAAMVLLACSVSLRFFRFGGVQRMVLNGIAGGFLLYVISKVTEDLSRAELMAPVTAAWLPVLIGGLTGVIALLYQEDG
jgi:lipopolysaccharide export system permease protein